MIPDRPGTDAAASLRIVVLGMAAWLLVLFGAFSPCHAGSPSVERGTTGPGDRTEPWRVVSFLEDANLEGRGIFHLDFEQDGTVWIAASDGLYRYDGYHWDRFTSDHGLPSDYVRAVRVTRDGDLWVATDRGAGIFDEETFDSRDSLRHLPGPSVRRITEDPDGTLWFACDQWPPSDTSAGLARYRNGEWTTWTEADGLPSDYVSDVFTSSDGEHFVLTRGGLAQFDGDRLRLPLEEAGLDECRDYIWSMVEGPTGRLIATTRDHVCVREDDRWRSYLNGPPSSGMGEITVTRDGAVITCSSERFARFAEWNGTRFVAVRTADLDTRGSSQYLAEAPDGSIWVVGVDLLARWERTGGEWRVFDDLPRPVLRDEHGGIWFADNDQVLRLEDDEQRRFPGAAAPVASDPAGGVWMRTPQGLARWKDGELKPHALSQIGLEEIRGFSADGAGSLWLTGRDGSGRQALARFDGEGWTSFPFEQLAASEHIRFGVPDVAEGMWYVAANPETDLYRVLRVRDTTVTEVPLPEVARRYWIPHIAIDQGGTLWLYGILGLYRKEIGTPDARWQRVEDLPGRQVLRLVVRGPEVWFSYVGSSGGRGGISRFANGTWRHFAGGTHLLTRGGSDDLVFFTDPDAIHIVAGPPLEPPRLLRIPEPGPVESLVAGLRGDFWMGTERRTLHYLPDGIPPDTLIDGGEKAIIQGENLVLGVRGVERFVPRAESRPFEVSVRRGELPWSDFAPLRNESITLDGLLPGDHVIQVCVRDQGMDVDPDPAVLRLRVYSTPLQERRWFQALVLGVFLTVLFLAVLSIVARQREVSQRRKRRALERELLQISEREQRRIGRDLHDGLGQRLTGISFQCEALRGMVKRGAEQASEQADEIGASVRDAISETRSLAHALYPPELDRGNLDIALQRLVETTGRGFAGTCVFHHGWTPDRLSRKTALNVYRLVQEALSNAVRHAGATEIDLDSRRAGKRWIVEVRDNGRGFDAQKSRKTGLGLRIMRYRATLVGGWLEVESSRVTGTTVRCSLRATGNGSGSDGLLERAPS